MKRYSKSTFVIEGMAACAMLGIGVTNVLDGVDHVRCVIMFAGSLWFIIWGIISILPPEQNRD